MRTRRAPKRTRSTHLQHCRGPVIHVHQLLTFPKVVEDTQLIRFVVFIPRQTLGVGVDSR